MSETLSLTAELSYPPFIIMKIITSHTYALEALATASADSLDYAALYTSYKNAINLACVLYSRENLTNWFAMLVTKTEDLMLKYDATIADCNMLTTRVMQL
jgi:hypothetical protein